MTFSAEAELPDEVRAEFRKFKRESDIVVQDILRDGIRTGEFVGADENISVFAIDGMCNWLWKWYRQSGPLSPDEIADRYADLVLYGLSPRENGAVEGPDGLTREELIQYHSRAIRFHNERIAELAAE